MEDEKSDERLKTISLVPPSHSRLFPHQLGKINARAAAHLAGAIGPLGRWPFTLAERTPNVAWAGARARPIAMAAAVNREEAVRWPRRDGGRR